MAFTQCRTVDSSADSIAPLRSRARVNEVLRSPGQPLDVLTRAHMEPLFGFDFSHVRVHAGPEAASSAASIGARAYAVGPHIVFGRSEHSPGTSAGATLMAHELAHVVQQHGQASGDPASLEIGEASDAAERSAHAAARQVIAGRAANPGLTAGNPHSVIRRWSSDEMSVNLTPPNVRQENEPSPGQREPVWCQFGGRDRADECRPLPACRTTSRSTWDFVAIFRVDGAPPASPFPASARTEPIDVEGDLTFVPNSGPEQPVGHFAEKASYSGRGNPVFRQRISFSSAQDGQLTVMLKIGTNAGVVIFNGGVSCERINCT
ncbi:MAG TPA: DUF4157 domain-containing protein [Vicinamibacterales bacterium]|jgi:hypothetical protein|nr:DUF4157 domain-containing protein [Vicinamibacterales bacterium]